jgi:DNA/RNA endonuclease YhcR with UshA esterase domain/exonuclease III
MFKRSLIIVLLAAVLILSACDSGPGFPPASTEAFPVNPTAVLSPTFAPPAEPTVLISEVLTGVEGNNNFDFIELYNTGAGTPIDLKGWSLWYKLSDNDDEKLVYRWMESTLVPPQGHYLLVYEGQDLGVTPDAVMDISIIPQRGALQLRRMDNAVVDSLSWGSGAEDYAEGSAAAGMKNSLALERAPGGSKGNWIDTHDNGADFAFSSPNPQNTGSPLAPDPGDGLVLLIEAPDSVLPGSQFVYTLSVANDTSQTVNGVTVQIPIPRDLDVVQIPTEIEIFDQAVFWDLEGVGQVALWDIGSLDAGGTASASIAVNTPWTYMDVLVANYSAQAEDWPTPTFGSPVRTAVTGGTIPIGALRDLVGKNLVIEGTATMYTGGYYAGTGNVKFYLEDETGGVLAWVPGGDGEVDVSIGDLVQVAGKLEVYRGALELVVNDLSDVELLSYAGDNPDMPFTIASIGDAANDPGLAGKLIQVEGIITRNEEFSYSYELDLIDETGQLITLYIDKLTNINVETVESGHHYRTTGILEIYDTRQQLYPRIQGDLERVYPPVLTLEMDAPNTVATGENVEITLTAINYTPDPLTGVVITATMPKESAQFVTASEGADISGSNIIWTIPEVAAGASVSVRYTVQAMAVDGSLTFKEYTATANEWLDPVGGDPYLVFLGDTVPIWAIQGPGSRSPYTFSPVKTTGIVTGVFPGLGGFWIQETVTDSDPLTSAGLFIHTGDLDVNIAAGNTIQVSGTVRETYQQTQVQISNPGDIVVLNAGGPLPASVELDPPPNETEADAYNESLEGMLVQVSDAGIAVGPTSRYGEYVLVLPKHGVNRLWQGDLARNGLAIMVDDGSSMVHEDNSTLDYVVNTGDQVSNSIGPLAFTYGRYKIEPIVQPQVFAAETELPILEPTHSDAFSIMTWNVENLFDVLDPHPSDPEKPSIRAYKVSIAKVANTILAAGIPTIIGLQEVENIDILEDIAEHEVLAGYGYQPFLIEGTDSRYIDNGYLVRGGFANVVDVQQHVAPEGLTSRPPVRIEVEIETDSGPVTVFVLNNHFTSMSGGEEATEPRRAAQAAWNVSILESILEANPDAYVAVIGDLNSYYDSLPVDTLRDAGLIHVFEINPEDGWYSYIYQGASQTLDHILVSASLYNLVQRVEVLHTNADYAPPVSEDESPLRKSDHDPVVATFSLLK